MIANLISGENSGEERRTDGRRMGGDGGDGWFERGRQEEQGRERKKRKKAKHARRIVPDRR